MECMRWAGKAGALNAKLGSCLGQCSLSLIRSQKPKRFLHTYLPEFSLYHPATFSLDLTVSDLWGFVFPIQVTLTRHGHAHAHDTAANRHMASSTLAHNGTQKREWHQNVVVMRHGERLDNFNEFWVNTAQRPWDPPLHKDGFVRAFNTGRKLRTKLGYPIHRVFVSPFLRCVQTASQVVSALCAVDDDVLDPSILEVPKVKINPTSSVKVSIEYGLCEMLNTHAIRGVAAPKDGNFDLRISELEGLFPAEMVDHSVERVYNELPHWEETTDAARTRYERIIKALADKYPSENLLLVTHGEGVGVSVSAFLKDVEVYEVEYCAYTELRRQVFQQEQSFTSGDFELRASCCGNGILCGKTN